MSKRPDNLPLQGRENAFWGGNPCLRGTNITCTQCVEVPRKLQSTAKLLWHNHSLHAKGKSFTCLGGSLNPCSYISEELVVNVYLATPYFPWEAYFFYHVFLNINKEPTRKGKSPYQNRKQYCTQFCLWRKEGVIHGSHVAWHTQSNIQVMLWWQGCGQGIRPRAGWVITLAIGKDSS